MEVINEEGVCVVELRSAIQTEFSRLSTDLVGFWKTKTISSAVELKIFESLPAAVEKIALNCGLKLDLTKRLLRALGELNLLEYSRGVWSVTAKGAYLQQAHPMTLADAAIEYEQYLSPMWNGLSDAIRGNDKWHAPDIFNQVALDGERTLPHHRMLQSYALHDYAPLPEVLNLDSITHLIDAGGGTGSLTKYLAQRYESLKISLFDLPEVIDHARNLIGIHEQIEFHGGDLFQPWGLHADAVLLARVLHDWDDQAALAILQRARSTLPIGGRIFIVEMLLLEDEMSGGLCDLHLLMATGGRERTLSGYRLLLESAGFYFHESVKLNSLPTVLVGVAK
ncbi:MULTISPECIES: methyltransferase [unclassified Undibacterium]|uniref:methyltransferase n=1 Tax=unclassified Undibacterium TaxID=2630295 RepID=UPI002AC8BAC8|nr:MULTISPECIES: methyltransferase [unclassified Undibacterium]MEB0141233.1 methyltransferase [Undibacterium sp. CCC2.1]MEB0174296.1 methyltransferase [Undibacterium sp. CCC1.1]MEB0178240.1 methyltransferase [Undibacterium sp. CCC3.4]MEB0217440.1 methyltransferase [Undibacterium sp. 5I2]WPX42721.1 methyltransferase [Undibacterium sp. CCC3.4]